ncbi:cytochrome c oxidase subunit 6B2-like isoform X2 [Monodelphis domestica]|uniref:cytochrome c oxidase subunit 6B2-like isoform X2 n=1 Tax=Monodelphis domestica TaxID=13616 RepID=UPI0024E20F16|nr:cytochrome c oxidase subunit 6B2-like isoform X2 [Monodelphis domestica]
MESLLPRDLKAGTGRLPAGTSRVGGTARVRVPDFHRCTKILKRPGKDSSPCDYCRKVYHSLWPLSWLQRWTDQIREGTFPGKI